MRLHRRAAALAWAVPALCAALVALAGLAGLPGAGSAPDPRVRPSPLIGQRAPAFTLPHLHDGSRVVTAHQMQGQVWVLNVWASWCAPCRDEHPLLLTLAREQGVPLMGLNHRDDPRSAQEWLLAWGDPYRAVALDLDGAVSRDYGVQGVPQTFVIDRAGIVRHRHVGPLTARVWSSELLPLIRRLQG